MRLDELDEQLKPESIERELAGIGSRHPEELREHRRKLLTIERNGLRTQLDLLAEQHARTEAAISEAESTTDSLDAQPSPAPLAKRGE
jgi:chromosome segregation ATPase